MSREASERRARIRAEVLSSHGEQMISLLRYHAAHCQPCGERLCDDGIASVLASIDEELVARLVGNGE